MPRHSSALAFAATAAGLVAASSLAGTTLPKWEVALLHTGAPATASATALSLKEALLPHLYNHILGVPNPAALEQGAPSAYSAGSAVLPSTSIFVRPQAAMVLAVEGAGEDFVPSGAARFHTEDGALGVAFAAAAPRRSGLSEASFELVAPSTPRAIVDGAAALRWTDHLGFVSASHGPLKSKWAGALACTPAGEAALVSTGAVKIARSASGATCGAFEVQLPSGGAATTLDAQADVSVRHALSEAALVLLAARHMAAPFAHPAPKQHGPVAGLTLLRMSLTGLAHVAAASGADSEAYAAARIALQASVVAADSVLREALPVGRYVSAVLSSALPAHTGLSTYDAELSAARRAQIDPGSGAGGAEASASPIPTPAAGYIPMGDIGNYQVILWTAVLLGAITLYILYFMLGMDGGPRDPQLYAQIADVRAARTGGK